MTTEKMTCPNCKETDYFEVNVDSRNFTATWTCDYCEVEHEDFDDIGYHFAEG